MFEFNGTARCFGRQLALGFLDIAALVMVCMFIAGIILTIAMPTDDSDFGKWDRSGVKIVTDAKTGQQYLVTPEGGIIERKSQ